MAWCDECNIDEKACRCGEFVAIRNIVTKIELQKKYEPTSLTNFLNFETVATFDCDDTLIMWDIGDDSKPYDLRTYEDQQKVLSEDVVTIDCPWNTGVKYYPARHNKHIKLISDYKARGFGVVIWSAGGAAWAKAVAEALGIAQDVDMIMSKPSKHVDDLPCTKWMGEQVYIPYKKLDSSTI